MPGSQPARARERGHTLCPLSEAERVMTWLFIVAVVGVVMTLTLWVTFVYIAVREIKTEMPSGSAAGNR